MQTPKLSQLSSPRPFLGFLETFAPGSLDLLRISGWGRAFSGFAAGPVWSFVSRRLQIEVRRAGIGGRASAIRSCWRKLQVRVAPSRGLEFQSTGRGSDGAKRWCGRFLCNGTNRELLEVSTENADGEERRWRERERGRGLSAVRYQSTPQITAGAIFGLGHAVREGEGECCYS